MAESFVGTEIVDMPVYMLPNYCAGQWCHAQHILEYPMWFSLVAINPRKKEKEKSMEIHGYRGNDP